MSNRRNMLRELSHRSGLMSILFRQKLRRNPDCSMFFMPVYAPRLFVSAGFTPTMQSIPTAFIRREPILFHKVTTVDTILRA